MTHAPLIDLPSLREVITFYQLQATKNLGQNFLTDLNLTRKIVRAAGDLTDIHVIEIGPGPGGLTRALLESPAASVTVVELDARCIPIMQELQKAYPDRLHIVHADALNLDISTLQPAPRAIIANLPYNVATPLLINWLDMLYHAPNALQSMTLMFQKEVAERICSEPNCKSYGRLSIIAQWLCDVSLCFDIPPSAFLPAPKVTSTVIHLTPLTAPRYSAKKVILEKILASAFNQRRKMLRSSLKNFSSNVEELLNAAHIDPQRRAETLSIEEFCRIAQISNP